MNLALYSYIFCSLIHVIYSQNGYIISKIGKFCEINHFQKILWGNNNYKQSQDNGTPTQLWKTLMKQNSLQLKSLSNGERINKEDLIVFDYNLKNCNNTNFKLVCQNISNRPIKRSIIIVENSLWNTILQGIYKMK